MTTKAEYLGGAYIPGVPARDLTEAEWEEFKDKIEAYQAASRITMYTVKTARKKKADQEGSE